MSKPKKKPKGCPECEEMIPLGSMTGGPPNSAREELEENGIFMITTEISKPALDRIIQKLMLLHMDPDFITGIQIFLNSPGGYCDAGWSLIDVMNFVKMPIRTVAMGEICSMATHIFVAGDHRVMAPNAMAMIHQFSAGSYGNYSDLIASRKGEDLEQAKSLAHLLRNSKYTTEKQVRKRLLQDQDLWLSPKEMKKHGLCDKVYKLKKRKK